MPEQKTQPKGTPQGGQKPPDIKEIMADYDKFNRMI